MPREALAAAASGFGWTGKLPGSGDFVTGGCYSPFLVGVRDWLSAGMDAARAQGLDLDRFLTTPFVRLVAGPAAFGGEGGVALLGPGMDAVGRAFPFAIVCEMPAPPIAEATLEAPFFVTLEDAFLGALSPETGEAALAPLAPPPALPAAESEARVVCICSVGARAPVRFEKALKAGDFALLFDGAARLAEDGG